VYDMVREGALIGYTVACGFSAWLEAQR
jgi:hypothetical protein